MHTIPLAISIKPERDCHRQCLHLMARREGGRARQSGDIASVNNKSVLWRHAVARSPPQHLKMPSLYSPTLLPKLMPRGRCKMHGINPPPFPHCRQSFYRLNKTAIRKIATQIGCPDNVVKIPRWIYRMYCTVTVVGLGEKLQRVS